MKITKREMDSMSNKQLYEMLIPNFKRIAAKQNLSLDTENIEEIILETLDDVRTNFSENVDLNKSFEYYLMKNLRIQKQYDVIGKNSKQDYYREIEKFEVLSNEKERELYLKAKNGDKEAKDLLISSNLKMVKKLARRYVNKGISYQDLIQEGNLGLMCAFDRFDEKRNNRFSTYAYYWVKKHMLCAINTKARMVKIPVEKELKLMELRKIISALAGKLDRKPRIEEIAEAMNISINEADELFKLIDNEISLNQLVGQDKNHELEAIIEDSKPDLEEEFYQKELNKDLLELINNSSLEERDKRIIILRYGLADGKPRSLQETGFYVNLTKEGVRLREMEALKKLRESKYSKHLKSYLNDEVEEKVDYSDEPKNKTIYGYFKGWKKEEINNAISKLDDDRKRILLRRFGGNLENPGKSLCTQDEYYRYYNCVIPKIRWFLDKEERIKQYEKKYDKSPSIKSFRGTIENNIVKSEEKEISESNNQLQELIKNTTFYEMLEALSINEVIVTILYLGLKNDECYSLGDIAKFTNKSIIEVNSILVKALFKLKKNFSTKVELPDLDKEIKKKIR